MKEYYKKIDKSFFKHGITIPKERISDFIGEHPIALGCNRKIKILWQNDEYSAIISHVDRKAGPVHQVRWDGNRELLASLKKEFIQSYFAIESQKYEAKRENKYHITSLMGGSQEVVVFKVLDEDTIKLETFIKIETPYDNIFKNLVDENVFGWLGENKYSDNLISKSTKWFDIKDLYKHEDINHVIYYLVDDKEKQIYIGSATRLGDRVKPNRPEIPGWNKFRYEIIKPKFHYLLRTIEYHSIMNFAAFYSNKGNIPSLALSDYLLVNKDYKFYMK